MDEVCRNLKVCLGKVSQEKEELLKILPVYFSTTNKFFNKELHQPYTGCFWINYILNLEAFKLLLFTFEVNELFLGTQVRLFVSDDNCKGGAE